MTAQAGLFAFGATEHLFLTFNLTDAARAEAAQVDAPQAEGATGAHKALSLLATYANPATTDGVNVVVGVRPSLWANTAAPQHVPANVHDYTETKGTGKLQMPPQQDDFWMWISGSGMDVCWDWAKQAIHAFQGVAELAQEHRGWSYHGNKDLTGFVDGTENPGRLEAPAVVAVPDGQPGAGSSVLLYQPFQHLEYSWYDRSVEAQEESIGRTKLDNVEFDDEVKPLSSHVARTNIDTDERSIKIWRRNVAYGDMHAHGTLFVGFTNEQWKIEDMLDRMVGVDGIHDSIMDFMKVTGSGWYVIPSVEGLLEFLPEDEDED